MTTNIFVESNELRDAARRMDATIRSMTEIQRAILQIDNRVAGQWQGKAAAQNVENFRALNDMTNNYLSDAQGTRAALDSAIAAYDATEQSQVTKVGQLSTKNIF
jgi:uncharacterized protein YukE